MIIPVRNEENTIVETLEKIYLYCKETFGNSYKMIVIDDKSTDRTLEKIRPAHNSIGIYTNKNEPGKGSAIKYGYIMAEAAYGMNYDDLICFIDGDGQIEPQEIKTLLKIMDFYDADVVIGNKRHTYSNISYCLIRRIVSRVYNLMIRFLFDLNFTDTQCGIKIFKKAAIEKVIHKIYTKRYAFDLELLVAIKDNCLRIADAPVIIRKQLNAGSVNIRNIIVTFFDTVAIYLKHKKGFYCDT